MPRLVLERFRDAATRLFLSACISGTLLFAGGEASGVETVQFRESAKDKDSATRTVVGEVMFEKNGGMMLMADDGRIWRIEPQQIVSRRGDKKPLVPLTDDEMENRMRAELPAGFQVYRTPHYIIVHNTNDQYVKRVGAQFEQLYRGFFTFWKNQRWKLPQPRFPLVAMILSDKDDFLRHGVAEIGDTAKNVIGYYHLTSNRLVTFNMPNLERNIATIIHEGTHQLAYNCGMQTRFADNPMWTSEGLAMFFESPDMSSPRGWRGIGRVNQVNLARWHRYLPNRPAESLATLLTDDMRFRNAATAENAYGEGWAFTYFLIKTRRKEYTTFLKRLSEGAPLVEKTPRERIEIFEESFGTSLVKMDQAFQSYMRRVR